MLFGPVQINFTSMHSVNCALHTDRANIDMGNDHRDENKGDDTVPELVILLFFQRRQIGWQAEPKIIEQREGIAETLYERIM